MSAKRELEYAQIKQPVSLDLYIEKIKGMNERTILEYHNQWLKLLNGSSSTSLPRKIITVIEQIISKANSFQIKPSTFRFYKASVLYGLAETQIQLENNLISESDIESGLNEQFLSNQYKSLNQIKISYGSKGDYSKKTSALKLKSFPKPFYDFLLKQNHPRLSRPFLLTAFVKANILVGLRPIEWLNTSVFCNIENKCLGLLVENGKNSNGRANGNFRELILTNINQEESNCIFDFYILYQNQLAQFVVKFLESQKIYESKSSFVKEKRENVLQQILPDFTPSILTKTPVSEIHKNNVPQKGLANIILRSFQTEMYSLFNQYRKTNPNNNDEDCNRVCLYSTRHQCIANAKQSGINKYEIAGFFGHSDKETSSKHYAKAWSGWSSFKFKPSIESVLAVKDSADYVYKEYGITNSVSHSDQSFQNVSEIRFHI